MPNVSVKRAMELYRKAHQGLTAQEEADAHKGEELLKKKGIVPKRVGKGKGKDKFTFGRKKMSSKTKPKNKKKKLDESRLQRIKDKVYLATRRPSYKGSGPVNAQGMPYGDEEPMSNVDWAKYAARNLGRRIVDLIKGRNNKNKPQQQQPQEEDVPF